MPTLLEETLEENLRAQKMLGFIKGCHFIVAYSGGRDSTALLHSLVQLRDRVDESFHITAAYYWHPWRPLQDDLQIIYNNCKARNIRWVVITPNLALPKTEVAAREDRYKKLAHLAKDLQATAILTAHHQDDQIETILFRLFRGTGIEGLTGIPKVREINVDGEHYIPVIRPFLDISRETINAYAQEKQLAYVDDPTNKDVRFTRNRIRHDIVPKIKEAFPDLERAIFNLAHLTSGELEIIDKKMDEIWSELFDPETRSINLILFNQLAHAFQRRIVRRFIFEEFNETIGHKKVEEIIDFIAGKNRRRFTPSLYSMEKDRFIQVFRNKVSIETRKEYDIEPLELSIPGQVSHEGLKLSLSIKELSFEERFAPIDYEKLSPNEAFVDLSNYLEKPLTLRSRQKGDRIKPFGMDESIKLKKYLIKRGVSRFKRDLVPLLTCDSEVLWAVGLGLNQDIRVITRPTHRIEVLQQ